MTFFYFEPKRFIEINNSTKHAHAKFFFKGNISWYKGGGVITNDVLKFKKTIELESSCVVIYMLFFISNVFFQPSLSVA